MMMKDQSFGLLCSSYSNRLISPQRFVEFAISTLSGRIGYLENRTACFSSYETFLSEQTGFYLS